MVQHHRQCILQPIQGHKKLIPGLPLLLQVLQPWLQRDLQPNRGHQMLMLGSPRVLQVLQAGLQRVLQPIPGHRMLMPYSPQVLKVLHVLLKRVLQTIRGHLKLMRGSERVLHVLEILLQRLLHHVLQTLVVRVWQELHMQHLLHTCEVPPLVKHIQGHLVVLHHTWPVCPLVWACVGALEWVGLHGRVQRMCAWTKNHSPIIVIFFPPATFFVLRFDFQTNWWPNELPMRHIAPRGWGLEGEHSRHTGLNNLHPLVHAKHQSMLIDRPPQPQLIADP